jgi:hypothetical protein
MKVWIIFGALFRIMNRINLKGVWCLVCVCVRMCVPACQCPSVYPSAHGTCAWVCVCAECWCKWRRSNWKKFLCAYVCLLPCQAVAKPWLNITRSILISLMDCRIVLFFISVIFCFLKSVSVHCHASPLSIWITALLYHSLSLCIDYFWIFSWVFICLYFVLHSGFHCVPFWLCC